MERNSSGPAVYRLEHSDLPLDRLAISSGDSLSMPARSTENPPKAEWRILLQTCGKRRLRHNQSLK